MELSSPRAVRRVVPVSSTDFRQIAIGIDEGRPERLFRAAVSAFCSLTRPTRQEIVQLDELALPLYDQVSPGSRRFVAAALSESPHAPVGLVSRLAMEDIEIAAPLLLRSTALADAALVSIIARQGLPHARAIVRRPGVDPAIAALVRALEASAQSSEVAEKPAEARIETAGSQAEAVRNRLRAMMADAGASSPGSGNADIRPLPAASYKTLRKAALSGMPALFQTALADALDIRFGDAGLLMPPGGRESLKRVLAGLGLTAEQALVLATAAEPSAFDTTEAVRAFVDTFDAIGLETGRDEIRQLRSARLSALTTRLRAIPGGRSLKA